VHDFDEQVQIAINRRQRLLLVQSLTHVARRYGYQSISYDLIYGLPRQYLASLNRTLQQLVLLAPDRIAYYHYAHLPERFSSQRAIDRHQLPAAAQNMAMLALIAQLLTRAGYCHIGMDHFAKSADDLSIAQHRGALQRNEQGYSSCLAPDRIGFGVSAIRCLSNSFSQNEKQLANY
jgi:oxygen-independent coproporphyrinogen-3 oxidase